MKSHMKPDEFDLSICFLIKYLLECSAVLSAQRLIVAESWEERIKVMPVHGE